MSWGEAVASLSSMDSALDLAHGLLKLGKDGLGKQSGATIWEVRAVLPLAVILFAAGPVGCGEGEHWVRAAVDNADPEDTAQPGWARAALLCATSDPVMARSMAGLTALDQRQRDCVVMALRAALDESPDSRANTARVQAKGRNTMYVKPSTPYCGFGRRAGGTEMFVPSSAAHVLVSAPTETGKSRRLLAPAATLWGGPAVVVSSKDDLMQYVMERRWGPKALLDLRPLSSPVYPEGVVPTVYDPTVSIDSPYEALTVAETIMQMSTVGLGSGADQVSDGGVWESQAAGPLAAFLFAASPAGNSKGMAWVLTAVDNIDPENSTQPGWVQAAALCHEYPTLAMGMARIMEMDPRQRDSVAITMRKAITPWLRTSLLDREGFEPFTPDFLDDPLATLFILAPADGTVAGSAVTLLDSLVRRWREKTSARETMHRLLMVIDELPNTAPIPNLRRIVGEGRGLGINLMVAVQASSQLDTVYGAVYANELRDIFPCSVIMFGAREEELLTAAEHWSGLTNRRPQGFGQNDGSKNLNNDLGATLRWQELLPPTREHARLLIRGGVGTCVEIPDWSVFLHLYDQTTQAILARAQGGGTDPGTVEPGRLRRMVRRAWLDRDNAA